MIFAVVPNDLGFLTNVTTYSINVHPDPAIPADPAVDAFDPHVSGDIVSYTAGAKIRYYDFSTGDDKQVPSPPGAQDLLSDVSGGKIVFSRVQTNGSVEILVYDTLADTTTVADPSVAPQLRFGSAIGGNTVAVIDWVLRPEGELVVADLAGGATRLTTDSLVDRLPNVSPSGDRIVWESCTSTTCDIHEAVRVGTSWTTHAITNNSEHEGNPDTDGAVIVYDATRSGERHIYWQPVGVALSSGWSCRVGSGIPR